MAGSVFAGQYFAVDVAGYPVSLPILKIKDDFAISLMMVIDLDGTLVENFGAALADELGPLGLDIIAAPATLGIPVAIGVTRTRGLERYVYITKVSETASGGCPGADDHFHDLGGQPAPTAGLPGHPAPGRQTRRAGR